LLKKTAFIFKQIEYCYCYADSQVGIQLLTTEPWNTFFSQLWWYIEDNSALEHRCTDMGVRRGGQNGHLPPLEVWTYSKIKNFQKAWS